MALLELILTETVASSTFVLATRKAEERAKVKASLLAWNQDSKPTPFLDGLLEKWQGTPESAKEKFLAQKIIDVTRGLLNPDTRTQGDG